MKDAEKVKENLSECIEHIRLHEFEKIPFWGNCQIAMMDALELLKEQEVRELTLDEWREWKNKKKRDPICELWENDWTPMWVLNPNDVHEPALLMGRLKLFNGKPTYEQCKAIKWSNADL